MAKLVLLQGGESLPFELSAEETVLGRHPECGIQIPSNMVSRKHARVLRAGDEWRIEDLESGNGTFVNGRRIEEATVLKHEDRVKLGPVLLRFEDEAAAALSAAGRPSVRIPAPVRSPAAAESGATQGFDLAIASDKEDVATIMGAVSGSAVFGALDAQPEAKLRGVIEIARALAGSLDVPSLLPKMLDTLFAIFTHADRGCILLRDAESGRMIPAVQKHRRAGDDSTVRLSRTVLAKVLEEKAAILSADAASDARFQASESISNLTIRSMMCAPLLSLEGEPLGIINIDTQNAFKQFTKDDLDLLAAVAGQAALSLETARLMQSYVDKQRQDGEMRIARNVQHALLPESLPAVEGYEFYAAYESAQEVGGDYYDCFRMPDGRIAVSFGDVAGKGVPGALVMARMSTVVQNTLAFVHEVGPAIATINNHMCSHAADGRFVTYVLAFVDPRTHHIALANGGHVAPLVRSPGGALEEYAEETIGLPVGVVEDYPFEVVERTLAPGETVVIVTDGVTEAMNPAGELYGTDRLKQLVSSVEGGPAETGRAILADVRRHAAGRDQNDDITVMTFGRLA